MNKTFKNKIVLLTSGQPSLNPRLVKEADTLAAAGFTVTVIYQYWNAWGTEMDQRLLPAKNWKAIRVGGSPQKNKAIYWLTRLQQKTAKFLVQRFGFRYLLAEKALGRCTFMLLKEALRHPADLYIAHNLAALPAAAITAKKRKAKCGFDAEDFHRHEITDQPNHPDVRLKTYLEDKYFPQTDYLTAGSLQIAALYQTLFPQKEITTILNAFPTVNRIATPVFKLNEPLKLFWFSQTVGLNRGLPDVLSAMKILEDENIELHILGFLPDESQIKLNGIIAELNFRRIPVLIFYNPILPDNLPLFAAKFDIGLALEPGFCINNDAALSNKIFTYLQAGLAVIASDTLAQQQFIAANPGLGFCYKKGNGQQLASVLKQLIADPDRLFTTKINAYRTARNTLNWETESIKFLKLINQTLSA